jgi:hypothetical protein
MGEAMIPEVTGRSKRIRDVVDAATRSDVGRRIHVVDRWEADLDAIGFSGRSRRVGLVYVSVSGQPPGSCYWVIESRSGATLAEERGDTTSLLNALEEAFPEADSRAG